MVPGSYDKFVSTYSGCYTQIRVTGLVDLYGLEKKTGITFNDTSLLKQVFIHSSYSNENPEYANLNNERLEFLGDSVLNFVISGKIYQEFPSLPEGKLTEIRVSLIREETLSRIASDLDLGIYLYLGKGEEATGGRGRQTNLADTFEALIGALFLDQGLSKTRDFILRQFNSQLNIIKTGTIAINYKSLLQEFTQAEYAMLPQYQLVKETGPDHDKKFTVRVMLGDRELGSGSGKSKKAAEMEAACWACEALKIS
jgi:ribonuclease-3